MLSEGQQRSFRECLGHKLSLGGLLVRIFFATIGGYYAAIICAAALASTLPVQRHEAILAGQMASFSIYSAFIIWFFAARTIARVVAGILFVGVVVGAACLVGGRLGNFR